MSDTDHPRSHQWPMVRKNFLAKSPECAACARGGWLGTNFLMQVHHRFPFHICVAIGRPDLELDERNFITLCERPLLQHHLLIGHLGSWQSYNRDLATGILKWGRMSSSQIRAHSGWVASTMTRPKPFELWPYKEREELRFLLDRIMPRKG